MPSLLARRHAAKWLIFCCLMCEQSNCCEACLSTTAPGGLFSFGQRPGSPVAIFPGFRFAREAAQTTQTHMEAFGEAQKGAALLF